MRLMWHIVAIITLCFLFIAPYVISYIVFWRKSLSGNISATFRNISCGCSIAVNFFFFAVMHKLIIGRWNFLYSFQTLLNADTYSHLSSEWLYITAFSASFSVVVGVVIRIILYRYCEPIVQANQRGRLTSSCIYIAVYVLVYMLNFLSFHRSNNTIIINEIQPYSVVRYNEMGYTSYIELYNPGTETVSIQNFALTGENDDGDSYDIPDMSILPGQYAIIQIDEDIFKLKSSGEQSILLISSDGVVVDSVRTEEIPVGYSYSRVEGSYRWNLCTATPGDSNNSGYLYTEPIAAPVFSRPSGFYNESFSLELSDEEDNVRIYYTTDGTTPTTDSILYNGPFLIYDRSREANTVNAVLDSEVSMLYGEDILTETVDKAFIVRAIAVSDSGQKSQESTAVYFINKGEYQDTAVLSIVADWNDLFGENGIYMMGSEFREQLASDAGDDYPTPNFMKRGIQYEIPVHVDFFFTDCNYSQQAGLRIFGNGSAYNRVKFMNLYARKQYSGSKYFSWNLFGRESNHKYSVRGGYANAVYQQLAEGRDVSTQKAERISLFLNGEFLCTTNLMEPYDNNYFEEHYGVPEENLILYDQGSVSGEGSYGIDELYLYLKNNDISDSTAYSNFCNLVDIQSYIDYMAIRIYLGDLDFSEYKNTIMWRTAYNTGAEYQDQKWRWALSDLDAMEWGDAECYGYNSIEEVNTFITTSAYCPELGTISEQFLFSELKNNSTFRQQFVNTFLDICNETFKYERVLAVMESYGEIDDTYQPANTAPLSMEQYRKFFRNRSSYIVPYMAEEMNLTGTLETLYVSAGNQDGGTVTINSITPALNDGVWEGQYYTDYPIVLSANPNPGYYFAGWEGDIYSPEKSIEVNLSQGGLKLQAIFEKE